MDNLVQKGGLFIYSLTDFDGCVTVETVVFLFQQKPDDIIRVGLDLYELEVTPAEAKATYGEIKRK